MTPPTGTPLWNQSSSLRAWRWRSESSGCRARARRRCSARSRTQRRMAQARSTSGWHRSRTSGSTGSPRPWEHGRSRRRPCGWWTSPVRVRSCSGTCGRSTRCSSSSTASRARAIPADDLETLKLELLVADRDHVERRLERVGKQAKSGDARLKAEAADLERLLAHLDAGRTLAEWEDELPPELDPLTTKPLLELVNGARRHRLAAGGRAERALRGGGRGVPRRRRVGARRGRAAAARRRST